MAFFDELGKKISQAGQTAVQKTKEMTDIAKLNGMISDEEKRINNNYYQIGKLYIEIHQNDFENNFAGMINAIRDSEAKIAEYKQQIQNIKGVVRCEKCGAEVDKNVAFCSSCGSPIQNQAPTPVENTNLIKCAGCGAMIDSNMRFCTSCGKPVAANAAPVEQPPVETTKKCPKCGVDVANDSAFCTECGTKLN